MEPVINTRDKKAGYELIEERILAEERARHERQAKLSAKYKKVTSEMDAYERRNKSSHASVQALNKEKYDMLEAAREYYGFEIDTEDERMRMMVDEIEKHYKLEQKKHRKAEKAKQAADKLQKMLSDIDQH